jgi:uncharacterized protein (TIGR02266 family)
MNADAGPRSSAEPPGAERRQSLRAPLIIQRVQIKDGRRTFFGYAKNISRGGMFIGATNPREPGARFQVEIPLPAPLDVTVTCNCEVAWARTWSKDSSADPGMGLKFLDLPEEIAEKIGQWIEDRRREKFFK